MPAWRGGAIQCPADSSGSVLATNNQLVCNCADGNVDVDFDLIRCADGQAGNVVDPAQLPHCDAATVPQAAMPCAATGGAGQHLRCPAGSAWWQSRGANVCFCEGARDIEFQNEISCNQNNVSYFTDVMEMPSCSAKPAFVKDFPCRAAGLGVPANDMRLCASGWIWNDNIDVHTMVCNCINGYVHTGDEITCNGQTVHVNQLGLCSEGEPASTAPTTAAPMTAAPTTGAAARPASGAAALLAALLMLAASL